MSAIQCPSMIAQSLSIATLIAAGVCIFVNWSSYVLAFDEFGSIALTTCPASLFSCPRLSVADLFGSALTCFRYRESITLREKPGPAVYWLESLFVCTVVQFGGTTLTGFLLGQTPSWLSSHTAWSSLALMWWLEFFCPGDIWHSLMMRSSFRNCVVLPGTWASSGHAVTSWGVDKSLGADHIRATKSVLTTLAAGTISACGGGVLADTFSLVHSEWGFRKPNIFRGDSLPIEKGFTCALFYYIVLSPHGMWMNMFAAPEARAATSIVMFLISASSLLFPESPSIPAMIGRGAGLLLHVRPYIDPKKLGCDEKSNKERRSEDQTQSGRSQQRSIFQTKKEE